jgi:hypothetical protein
MLKRKKTPLLNKFSSLTRVKEIALHTQTKSVSQGKRYCLKRTWSANSSNQMTRSWLERHQTVAQKSNSSSICAVVDEVVVILGDN